MHFGEQAEGLFKQYFPWIGLGLAVLIILVFIARRLLRKRASVKGETLDTSS